MLRRAALIVVSWNGECPSLHDPTQSHWSSPRPHNDWAGCGRSLHPTPTQQAHRPPEQPKTPAQLKCQGSEYRIGGEASTGSREPEREAQGDQEACAAVSALRPAGLCVAPRAEQARDAVQGGDQGKRTEQGAKKPGDRLAQVNDIPPPGPARARARRGQGAEAGRRAQSSGFVDRSVGES